MRLAVIVCTRNRCALLTEALRSFEACTVPEGTSAELIVVDNGSSDATKQAIERAAGRLAVPVKYVYEAKPGLSAARNAGLRAAQADIFAFTDDDCSVAADWIARLIEAFERHPHAGAVFGQAQAAEGAERRHMVATKEESAAREFRFPAMPTRIGHGNNMAFRREALELAGAFDESLGAGGRLRSAEDVDMAYRLLRKGVVIRYEPACRIAHAPREDDAEVRKTHWRNAIGLGACFGKHFLRGDLYALKCFLWLLCDLPMAAARAWHPSARHDLRTKALYLFGMPYGVAARLSYDLARGFPKEAGIWSGPCLS